MTQTNHHKADLLSNDSSGGFWNATKLVTIISIVGGILFVSGVYVWAQGYEDKIPPNVFIGDIELSGMHPDEAQQLLQARVDEMLNHGASVRVNDEVVTIPLATLVTTDTIEYADFALEDVVNHAMNFHAPEPFVNSWTMFGMLFEKTHLVVETTIHESLIQDAVHNLFPEAEELSQQAQFSFSQTFDGAEPSWDVQVIEGTPGTEFQWKPFFEEMHQTFSVLSEEELSLALIDVEESVTAADANLQIEQAQQALESMPHLLTHENDTWGLLATDLSRMILPGEDGMIFIDEESFLEWFEPIAQSINIEEQDARLVIEEGRVSEFVESEQGVEVQSELVAQTLTQFIQNPAPDASSVIAVAVIEPSVKTGDVNDLGITEILGTGTSSYRGSPWNRRQNIQNGVDLLNGLLIAPGEIFSLIDALKPFTLDNGYLPELVIKGDSIEPELGGGLCQIGTTTFRATMNSGLQIDERRNHSLVVSYYNDPSNGNPGTDATLYEPAPDFKFTNDTGRHILFQAENLTETQELRFTIWGTSDGRKGSYTAPVVHRWIPVGETRYVETEDLEPGEEECQEAHIGADTSFTYSVIKPTGETDEIEYSSHYRPLPRICLVGIEPEPKEEEEEEKEVEKEDVEAPEAETKIDAENVEE